MEFDLHSYVKVKDAIGPTDGAAAGASTVSEIVDTLGYESFEWLIISGTITTGTFTTLLQDGDDAALADAASVPADQILGVPSGAAGAGPSFAATDDNQVRRVGIISKKRYQRLTLVGASTPVGDFAVMALLGNPRVLPVPNQVTTS